MAVYPVFQENRYRSPVVDIHISHKFALVKRIKPTYNIGRIYIFKGGAA